MENEPNQKIRELLWDANNPIEIKAGAIGENKKLTRHSFNPP